MTSRDFLPAQSFDSLFPEEEHSRLILHNIEDCYLLVDAQLCIVYCNRAAREGIRNFLKVDVQPGMSVLKLAPERRHTALEKIYRNVLQGQCFVTEINVRDSEGLEIYFENNFLPAYNEASEVTGVIVFSKNITEKKKAEAHIRESEERLQFALEAANQGVWDWNLQTNEVIYSASYKKLYGFAENELKNHVSEWITRIHPEDREKMKDSVNEHLHSENPVYDSQYRIKGGDGKYRWVMAKGRILKRKEDGKPLRMIGTHTDITEAIEREAALKQINERFDCMLQATHELMWEWDIANNDVVRSKNGLEKVYGISDDSSLRKIDEWLRHLHPEDRPLVETTLKGLLNAPNKHTFEIEYRFLQQNGEYAHIYDRGILLKDEKGEPVRVIGSAENISERKRLEKELLKNELEYHRLIHQATVDTQEKERTEIGKELHDNINQVLTTTKLCLDLAASNAELREGLIQKSLTNINSVIQEIRHLSRSLMDPSLGDLGLVESINDLVESTHLTRQLKVVHSADAAVDLLLNANQKLAVFRIIQEALNNVLRHANATTVWILISIKEGQLHLTIKDDGVGFEPETIKRGVGIKNIQNRIYLINGTLQLESSPRHGCSIQLQFPIGIND